jgi:hypothetical protein
VRGLSADFKEVPKKVMIGHVSMGRKEATGTMVIEARISQGTTPLELAPLFMVERNALLGNQLCQLLAPARDVKVERRQISYFLLANRLLGYVILPQYHTSAQPTV